MNGEMEIVDNYTIALRLATEINKHRPDASDIENILEQTNKILQLKPRKE